MLYIVDSIQKLMKGLLGMLIGLMLLTSFSLAQNVYIPDPVFRNYLQQSSSLGGCMVGDSLDTQCPGVINRVSLNIMDLGIQDLTGISHFVSLQQLFAYGNGLTHIPAFPPNIGNVRLDENQLTSIPPLPNSIWALILSDNNLSSLPDLPDTLVYLFCDNNDLQYLPELPSTLKTLAPAYNENLHCLPVLPYGLEDLNIWETNITCIPNHPPLLSIEAPFSVPICTGYNPNGCQFLTQVRGTVYHDSSGDCGYQFGETDLQDRLVQSNNGYYSLSDLNGVYELYLDTGTYEISSLPLNFTWAVDCQQVPQTVVVDGTQDTIFGIDLANNAVQSCHWLNVDIGSSNQRPCFSTNSYAVSYCNYGTESAQDVYVDLNFPPEVIPLNSSIPWLNLGNGVYRFEVGDLDVDECGSINITDSVSCDAVVGSTVCVTAEIFPISPCLFATAQPGWDNSSIEVSGSCNGTNIDFLIENVGSGDMNSQANYRIYQDNALLDEGQINALIAGASTTISQLADGAAYRLEVDQSAGHPGLSLPRATVEGCGMPFSFGQVNISQQDDMGDHIEINCTELTASYDPNDKRVVPVGYGSEHIVHPNDSLLEYTIRFQNTGSDTAFTVEIVDTLPTAYLNPVTFLSGASSHPYTVRMHGNGIVTWRFENILLPDSATNEAGSQGFVKFKIRTRPDLPNGTVINNRANIYFDFNAAIVTETCFITISDIQIIASTSDIQMEDGLEVYPNPTSSMLNITCTDNRIQPYGVTIYDLTGREVLMVNYASGTSGYAIDVSGLSAGNYVVVVSSEQGVFREKVVVGK